MFDLNKFVDDVIYSRTISHIFGNPIYVSILIVLIIAFIIYTMFREDDDDNFWRKMARAGFYIIIPIIVIIMIHYKNLEKEFENTYENKLTQQVVNGTVGAIHGSGIEPELGGAQNHNIDLITMMRDEKTLE